MLGPMLQASPTVGTEVGMVMHKRRAQWIRPRGKVKAVVASIVILEDGSWEFYWNLVIIGN